MLVGVEREHLGVLEDRHVERRGGELAPALVEQRLDAALVERGEHVVATARGARPAPEALAQLPQRFADPPLAQLPETVAASRRTWSTVAERTSTSIWPHTRSRT